MLADQDTTKALVWAIEHFSFVGWCALIAGAWKAMNFITKIQNRAITAEQHITTLATNHFPHMEASLKNQDGLLKSMDESLKTIADHQVRRKKQKE